MSRNVIRNKSGRPRIGKTVAPAIPIRFPEEITRAVDAWGKRNKVKTRSEAIRRLVERGLASKEPEKP
jgi:metal-responsive CopG/Arc/MetJ family transcriptional regulator